LKRVYLELYFIYHMKKAILTILVSTLFVTQSYAQFQVNGNVNGNPVQLNSNGQFQVGGTINGNQVIVGNNGVSVSGSNGFFSLGSVGSSGMGNNGQLVGLIVSASRIIGMLVPIMISLAVLAFFFYLVRFIWKGAEDPKAHADGMKGMGYSIFAIFVMVSIWGIIAFIGTTIGVGQGGSLPDFKLPGFK
jgi:hypothetical protein